MHKENNKYYVDCSKCGKEFEVGKNTYYVKKPHICPECRIKHQKESNEYIPEGRKLLSITCDECNREFVMTKERVDKRFNKYKKNLCTSCSKKSNRNPFCGKKFSDEQKDNFSRIRTAYYADEEHGTERRIEVSKRVSGKNNPMYKGPEFVSNYGYRNKKVRERALERDNYECQYCHETFSPSFLVGHHKNSCNWDIEGRTDINNVVTLCKNCHKLFHHIYGYGENTAEQFDEFLKGSETRAKCS